MEKSEKVEGNIRSVQKQTAELDAQFHEINESLRHMNGQFEVLQKQITDLKEQNQHLENRLEETDKQNKDTLGLLEQEIELLRSGRPSARGKDKRKSQNKNYRKKRSKKTSLLLNKGNQHFQNKRWKQAIINFENYRQESAKKDSSFAHATYRIALSFEKLGMKENAKSYFEELVKLFPRSHLAQKAKSHLDKI